MTDNLKHLTARAGLRERIVETAASLFISRGIKSVKMDDVAAALTISKRTLYEVFPDKESLLMEVIRNGQTKADDYLRDVVASGANVMEVLLKMFEYSTGQFHSTNPKFFEEVKRYPKAFHLMARGNNEDTAHAVDFLRRGVDQGIFRDDINFAIINQLITEQFNVLLHTDISSQYPFIEVYESIMFTQLRGLSTERGARELEEFITRYRKEREPEGN